MVRLINDKKLDFKDVLLRPKRSFLKSRAEIDLSRTFHFRNSKASFTGIPIMAANMDTTGTFEMAVAFAEHEAFVAIHKYYPQNAWEEFSKDHPQAMPYVALSAGASESDYENMCNILNAVPEIQYVCIDVANGYSQHFVEHIRMVRENFPNLTVIAGNVVTPDMTEELILSGADLVKVGIGPGSVCTTRKKTGVGFPQVSAILDCADAAHGLNGHIVSDGGCTCPGDVAKAFAAGADFVMIGGLFAGHDQCGGELIVKDGKKVKLFYGMSSTTAMKKHVGCVSNYRASEGKTVEVPYRGDINPTFLDIIGGIRSTCTYCGAGKLRELSKRASFILVSGGPSYQINIAST